MKKLTLLAIGVFAITASAFAGGCRNNCCARDFTPCDYPNACNGAVIYENGYYNNGSYVVNEPYYYNNGYVVNEPYYYNSGYVVREPTHYHSWNGTYFHEAPNATYFYAR